MQTNELMALIENLKSSEYGHIEVSHEGTHLIFDKNSLPPAPVMMAGVAPVTQPTPTSSPVVTVSAPTTSMTPDVAVETSSIEVVADAAGTSTIDSPIVGTFYDSPSPDAPAYVQVGSKVKKGDVVCIIEAMKLMNEIEAEESGEVVEILVSNEGPVEYNQPLFRIKPL